MITFYTETEESVEVIIKGKNDNDLKLNYDEKTNYHYVPVFGLYADYENSITIKVSDGSSESVKIKTDDIDDRKLLSDKQYSDEIKDDMYFITSPLSMSSYAFDAYGNIRWYVDSYYHNIEKLDNGHILIGNNNRDHDKNNNHRVLHLVEELFDHRILSDLHSQFNICWSFGCIRLFGRQCFSTVQSLQILIPILEIGRHSPYCVIAKSMNRLGNSFTTMAGIKSLCEIAFS